MLQTNLTWSPTGAEIPYSWQSSSICCLMVVNGAMIIVVMHGAIPNFATEKEQKRNFLDFTDVTLVVVDIKSERFVKSTCLQQDLFDMTMVTIMFDTKTSESESFIDRSIEGIINIMMEFHHF